MPDVYATIAEADQDTQQRLADILELRAADPQQQAMLATYLARIDVGPASRVLEIGCGTGAVSRTIAGLPGVAEVIGVDPSPVFVAAARRLSAAHGGVTFEEGDGRSLRFAGDELDAIVLHTSLCHIPEPELVLTEVYRILRPGGTLAICDGDYATITVALGDHDPLQDCIEAAKAAFINDVWLVRRLPSMLRAAGLDLLSSQSHGYLQTSQPDYMLTLVDRGADTLAGWGRIGPEMAAAMKAEARRRVEADRFFGFIGFVSVIARKPAG